MRRHCSALALIALCLVAAPAPAGAAAVGAQVERRAPSRYPENLPGCRPRCARGDVIPRRWVLPSRTVRLEKGEPAATVRFRCPGGRTFRSIGFLENGDVLVQIPRDQSPYRRRTKLRVRAERILTPLSLPAVGTLYAVCAPR